MRPGIGPEANYLGSLRGHRLVCMESEVRVVAIVDDDPGVCRALARLVRSLGFAAITYPSGEALLNGTSTDARPDEILLDLHLPGLRGPELLARIRDRLAARVVVMTGLDRPGARETCLGAGATAYITKPVTRDDLARLLARPWV